jgi:hypothetical protein
MMKKIRLDAIAILAVLLILAACDTANQKSGAKPEQTQEASRQAPPLAADSAFREWSTSIIEQASAQGRKIDSSHREALAMLLRVYLVRPDLHKGYGAPDQFNLNLLLQWAAGPAVTIDGAKDKLQPYANAYSALAKEFEGQKPVSIALK